ncbi:MAG: hypothetical protein M3N21_01160 [Actinomycetota bacterium]|nr:hypothetical protein [Actinomycetota bacterium]
MLWAVGDLRSFLLLLVGFVLAIVVRGVVQATVAARNGDRGPANEGCLRPDPRRHLDPFGAIAAALAGVGWGRALGRVDRRRTSAAVLLTVLPGVVVLAAGLLLLRGFRASTGLSLGGGTTILLRQGAPFALPDRALLLVGVVFVFVGLLSLVPLHPLDGSRLLFTLAPRTAGWQKAEYYLVEQNYGIGVLLVLLVPLGGGRSLMLTLLDAVGTPLVRLATGG